METLAQIIGGYLLLDPIGAAVKSAFAKTRKIENRLAQGLARYCARMDRDTTNPLLSVDDQH